MGPYVGAGASSPVQIKSSLKSTRTYIFLKRWVLHHQLASDKNLLYINSNNSFLGILDPNRIEWGHIFSRAQISGRFTCDGNEFLSVLKGTLLENG